MKLTGGNLPLPTSSITTLYDMSHAMVVLSSLIVFWKSSNASMVPGMLRM